MILQNNVTKVVSLCATGGEKEPFIYYPDSDENPILSNYNVDNGRNY